MTVVMIIMAVRVMRMVVVIVTGMIGGAESGDILTRLVREQAGDACKQEAEQRKKDDGCIHNWISPSSY